MGLRPDIFIIHLGSNDLGLIKSKALIFQAREIFLIIKQWCSGVAIIWSAMIPRQCWDTAWHLRATEEVNKNANREINMAFENGLECYLPHSMIRVIKSTYQRRRLIFSFGISSRG